jgi:hypothetical protein
VLVYCNRFSFIRNSFIRDNYVAPNQGNKTNIKPNKGKARAFLPCEHFLPSLIFGSKAGFFKSVTSVKPALKYWTRMKRFANKNTLAYLSRA